MSVRSYRGGCHVRHCRIDNELVSSALTRSDGNIVWHDSTRSTRTRAPPDVHVIEAAARIAPWVLRTLMELTLHSSVRPAAAALHIHHSTLQDRLATIEHELGWSVRTPAGRLRVQLALAVRRLLLHPAEDEGTHRTWPAGRR
ncbi:helix-turn-helix domain-containing protein [Streptomyces hokutonensis]|uniref:helix-turn-helix domain-containing protein n=1 Tax=Streptomyces hokutonensis TaxID=1306990 RepID=UPI0033D2728D